MKSKKKIIHNLYDFTKKENTINFSQISVELNKLDSLNEKKNRQLKNIIFSSIPKVKNKCRINLQKNNSQTALMSSIQEIKINSDEIEKSNRNLISSNSNLISTIPLDPSFYDSKFIFNANIINNKKIKKFTVSNLESTIKSITLNKTISSTVFNPTTNIKSKSFKNYSHIDPKTTYGGYQSQDIPGYSKDKYDKRDITHHKEIKRLIELISFSNRKKGISKVNSSTSVNFTKNIKNESTKVFNTPSNEMNKEKYNERTITISQDKDKSNILVNSVDEMEMNRFKKRRFARSLEKELIGKEIENSLALIKRYQNKIDQKIYSEKKEDQYFYNPDKLKNHIIRDHKIGSSNIIANSKKKFESTVALYESIEKKKRNQIEKEIEKFFKSKQKKSKFIETEEVEIVKIEKKKSNIDDEYLECRIDDIKRKLEKAKEESKKINDLIKDMSDEEYVDPAQSKKSKNINGVNVTNLRRWIRVRNIMKNRYDKRVDYLEMENPKKFKENKRNIHFEIMNSLKDLGPPNFLKTKFKISTILKCKNVEGLFFGSSSR